MLERSDVPKVLLSECGMKIPQKVNGEKKVFLTDVSRWVGTGARFGRCLPSFRIDRVRRKKPRTNRDIAKEHLRQRAVHRLRLAPGVGPACKTSLPEFLKISGRGYRMQRIEAKGG